MELTDSKILIANPNVAVREGHNEVVVLHLKDGTLFSFTGLSAVMWRRLQQPCTVNALVDIALASGAVPESAVARQTVLQLIMEMNTRRLLRIDDA